MSQLKIIWNWKILSPLLLLIAIFLIIVLSVKLDSKYDEVKDETAKIQEEIDKTLFLGATKFFYPEGSSVATSGIMAVSSNVQILGTSTTFRTGALICNTDSSNIAYLSFRKDEIPPNGTYDYYLGTGACFTLNRDNGLYQGAIRATSSAGSINLTITEFAI